jgi:hypothetical protein
MSEKVESASIQNFCEKIVFSLPVDVDAFYAKIFVDFHIFIRDWFKIMSTFE